MKEYRVRFDRKPEGPDDEAYFIKLEDDQGKSLGGPGTPYIWKYYRDSAVLILPTYEEKFKACRTTLSNIQNSIKFTKTHWFDTPLELIDEILRNVEETLEEIKNA